MQNRSTYTILVGKFDRILDTLCVLEFDKCVAWSPSNFVLFQVDMLDDPEIAEIFVQSFLCRVPVDVADIHRHSIYVWFRFIYKGTTLVMMGPNLNRERYLRRDAVVGLSSTCSTASVLGNAVDRTGAVVGLFFASAALAAHVIGPADSDPPTSAGV